MSLVDTLDPEEVDSFRKILMETRDRKKRLSEAKQVREIIPIEQWLENPYYVGRDGSQLYNYWKEHLIDIFSDNGREYSELIISGSLGTGKSTCALFCMLRKLYELSCYENIAGLFDLMSTSMIVFVYFSVNRTQAEMTGFGQFKSLLDSIDYFKDNFARNDRLNSIIQLPENLLFTHGSKAEHAIGMNMIGSILDEANFFKGEEQNPNKSSTEVYSQVANLYSSIVNRAKSRFMDEGEDHSLSILVSSATHSSSFTQKRIEKSVDNPHTKVIESVLWEVKPGKYSKETFWVFCGSELLDPYLVDSVADVNEFLDSIGENSVPIDWCLDAAIEKVPLQYKELFKKIPVDFRGSFEDNLIKALQDIAGVSVAPMGRLFSSRPVYNEAIRRGKKEGLKHPFYKDEFIIATGESTTIDDFLRKGFVFQNQSKPRFIHIDQSTTSDSTGISMCHIDRVEEINGVQKSFVKLDFMLKINPPKKPKEISISKIRDFVFYLRDEMNLDIKKVSYDWFGSQESKQILNEEGITAEHRSVDRSDEDYLSLIRLLFEERLDMYKYEIFENELFDLIHDRKKRRVDHPPSGCFTGDTEIKLLNGTTKTLKELSKEGKDKEFWVYSCTEDGQIVPAKAYNAHKTKENSELMEVELDNEYKIRCTLDHKFMLRDGSYKEAQNLEPGDSLMPLYYKYRGGGLEGYERIYNLRTQRWRMTHRLVAENVGMEGLDNKNNVIHHYDIDKLNNIPENLEVLSRKEHAERHDFLSKLAHTPEAIKKRVKSFKENYRNNPELQKRKQEIGNQVSQDHIEKMVELASKPEVVKQRVKTWKERGYGEESRKRMIKYNKSKKGREKSRQQAKRLNEEYWKSEEGKRRRKELSKTQLKDAREKRMKREDEEALEKLGKYIDYVLCPRHAMELVGGSKNAWKRRLEEIDCKKNAERLIGLSLENMLEVTGDISDIQLRHYLEKVGKKSILEDVNHKIKSVRELDEKEDVYDITVPKYHNFALKSGIFVHNSKDVSDSVAGCIANALETDTSESSGGEDGDILGEINNQSGMEDVMFSMEELMGLPDGF